MKWQTLGDKLPKRRNPLAKLTGRSVFQWMGWRLEGELPNRSKMIVALVPHSSNIDFILTLAVMWGLGLKAKFMMKHTVFWFPLGNLLRAFGGIAVDRRASQGLVEQMKAAFDSQRSLVLGITPEGTRSGAERFKSGFARIAAAAQVPILPAVIDYRTRTVRFAALIEDATNLEQVMERIRLEAITGHARI